MKDDNMKHRRNNGLFMYFNQHKWTGKIILVSSITFTFYLFCVGLYTTIYNNSNNLSIERRTMLINNLKGKSSPSDSKASITTTDVDNKGGMAKNTKQKSSYMTIEELK